VIRRGFWLAVGAALGVSGYRRAQRLARSGGVVTVAATAGRSAVHGAAFARDVRAGMALYRDGPERDARGRYLDRHQAGAGRTLDSQQRAARRPARGTAAHRQGRGR
jgi:hypothetical protein